MGRRSSERSGGCTGLGPTGMCRSESDQSPDPMPVESIRGGSADMQDKPTLHLGPHHLLHGKFVNLQKPYAVIRKAVGAASGTTLEGDSDEEVDMDEGPTSSKKRRVEKTVAGTRSDKGGGDDDDDDDDEDEEAPLFAADPDIFPSTPPASKHVTSSSPYHPASAARDYSSELDPTSSPPQWDEDDEDEEDEEVRKPRGVAVETREKEVRRKGQARDRRKPEEKERTRHYEVVGVVRRKVVFHLR